MEMNAPEDIYTRLRSLFQKDMNQFIEHCQYTRQEPELIAIFEILFRN